MRYLMLIPLLALTSCDSVSDAAQEVTGFLRPKPAEPMATGLPLPAPEALVETPLPEADPTQVTADPDALSAAGSPTVAGLGDPAKPGLWLETPLVNAARPGRVVLDSSGASVQVTLLPLNTAPTAGSRLSLDAMRALGAPLTELVELTVYPAS
ncbi:MAG: hypothetical protein GJ676_16300 [Rhodobacteraceae bacterium]|nr:hypothetical protein [Paracoccaceae bacterium]